MYIPIPAPDAAADSDDAAAAASSGSRTPMRCFSNVFFAEAE